MDKRQLWQEEFGDEYQVPVWTAQPGGRDHTSPTDQHSPHLLLVAAHGVIERARGLK